MAKIRLLLINPNSSASITAALRRGLAGRRADDRVELEYFTGPPDAPRGISDAETARRSSECAWRELVGDEEPAGPGGLGKGLVGFDGFLVCCFSDHPLVEKLRGHLEKCGSPAPVLGMLHAALAHALLRGGKFGIVTTGHGPEVPIADAVQAFLGGASTRFVGVLRAGLEVVELQEGERAKVERGMRETSAQVAAMGAEVVVLGCAGMCGMDGLVKEGAKAETRREVAVVDGVRAGVEVLVGLINAVV